MRWLIAAGVVLIIIIAMAFDKKKDDVDKMMKKVRAAKARKAKQRADAKRAQMKVA